MKHRKKIERRTFIEDRFEILIKKQKNGQATFNELTELDEIVNQNAAIREKILEEIQGFNSPPDKETGGEILSAPTKNSYSLFNQVKSFIGRLFSLKLSYNLPFLFFNKAGVFF